MVSIYKELGQINFLLKLKKYILRELVYMSSQIE